MNAEKQWLCHYPEFNDPACYPGHPDPKPSETRMPRKHTECGWYWVTPVNDDASLTDEQAVDLLVDFVRTPEWSVSMMEDIAVIVRKARPDIGDDYDADDSRAWRRH